MSEQSTQTSWTCLNCGQVCNSWATVCARCETKKDWKPLPQGPRNLGDVILPCPFCGGGYEIRTTSFFGLGREWKIYCNRCAADTDFWQPTIEDAVAVWNKRVP